MKQSPDIRQFITINLPQHLQPKDSVDNLVIMTSTREIVDQSSTNTEDSKLKDLTDFLPEEVNALPHEAKDVLQRLLEFDAQKRIRSVRSLQRIAMYMNFKIESQYCLKMRPLDIIAEDNITLYNNQQTVDNYFDADKAFKNF